MLSTGAETGLAFAGDGSRVWIARQEAGGSAILTATRAGDRWTAANPLPFPAPHRDEAPAVGPTGTFLVFASHRGATPDRQRLWMSYHIARQWTPPHALQLGAPRDADDRDPCVAADGALYFASTRQGAGGSDLYRSPQSSRGYLEPTPIRELNTEHDERQPCVDPRGAFLIFRQITRDGAQDRLMVSFRKNATWAAPRPLRLTGASAPTLSPDGRMLWHIRGGRIFSVPLADVLP
ncbi:MAG: PD40 domain-containing protein [Planctomycetes bacterium]|nr:PD40 domain-containing protein [Planctomycetota bacterium]